MGKEFADESTCFFVQRFRLVLLRIRFHGLGKADGLNFVFILADDMGYGDLSSYCPYRKISN